MNYKKFNVNMKKNTSKVNSSKGKKIIKKSLNKVPDKLNKKGTMNAVICMEEFAEATQQVSKWIRGNSNKTELTEELADAYLGIKCMQSIANISDSELNKAINVKLERQNKRNKDK